jgi:hypothetical protein
MAHVVVRNLRALTWVAIVAAWGLKLAVSGLLWPGDQAQHVPSSPAAESPATPDDLLHRHDCWRQDPPRDMRHQLPGHVVVTTRSGRTVYGGTRLVGRALDQELADKPAGLTVWGFCR